MKIALLVAVLTVVVLMAYVRLAPVDPARWHVDPLAPVFDASGMAAFCPEQGSRYDMTGPDPATLLGEFDHQVMATPRTRRIAGSPDQGLVTWETRSAFWGFPDYVTATTFRGPDAAHLCVVSRQRFGRKDFGVNAHRLRGWLQDMAGWTEPPDLRWSPPDG